MKNLRAWLVVSVFTIVAIPICVGQTYRVNLQKVSAVNYEGLHLVLFERSPKHPLVLPDVDTTNARFLEEFYTHNTRRPVDIAVMVIPTSLGELLYIDRNDNRDLTDDGPPSFFPYTRNEFTFTINSEADTNRHTLLQFQRTPDLPDSMKAWYVDSTGNLIPKFAHFVAGTNGRCDFRDSTATCSFKGKRGTFYFDTPLGVRQGVLKIGTREYDVGLYDFDNDGLFDGKGDVLLVDLNRDGTLKYETESFALSDVIRLDSLNVIMKHADPYGRWVRFEATKKPATPLPVSLDQRRKQQGAPDKIDPDVWKTEAMTLKGRAVRLNEFKAKYVLINFWGEWCGGCVAEIPALVQAGQTYRDKGLRIVSFLKYGNLKKAEEVIRKNQIDWPQLVLSDSLEKRFRITGYPTNILILPDGKRCVLTNGVTQLFFENYIK